MVELVAETMPYSGRYIMLLQHKVMVSDGCATKLGQGLFHFSIVIDEAETAAKKLRWAELMVEWMKVQIQCDAVRRGLPPDTSAKWLASLEEAKANYPDLDWPASV